MRKENRVNIFLLFLIIVDILAIGCLIGYFIGYSIGFNQTKTIEKETVKYVILQNTQEEAKENTTTEHTQETHEHTQEATEETNEETIEVKPEIVSLGMFEATAYCCENYPHICNNGDATKTATGATPTAGRTIAVDPKVIPYGTEVIINGHTYIAEDTGGAIKGNRVDILFSTHNEALDFGRKQVEVFVLNESE